jgi:hypothetical protein
MARCRSCGGAPPRPVPGGWRCPLAYGCGLGGPVAAVQGGGEQHCDLSLEVASDSAATYSRDPTRHPGGGGHSLIITAMDIAQLLPVEARQELDLLDEYLSSRRQSLPDLLRAWSGYARTMARHERIHMDDYLAMLFARDAIHDVVQRATPTVSRLLGALVSDSDSLFLFGTHNDDEQLIQSKMTTTSSAWWWRRAPYVLDE